MSKYFLLEVPDFARDESDHPLTSYLRLGTVQAPEHVSSQHAMAGRSLEHGAHSAASGAGEDLAALVQGFRDDERDMCDPPELDLEAALPVQPQAGMTAQALEAQWRQQQAKVELLDKALEAVLDDPEQWLDDLLERFDKAVEHVAQCQKELEEAQLELAQDSSQLPPAFSVPGYQEEQPEAPFTPYRTKAERLDESAMLHRRGGWRDHTDGNRVSTTRGDKVEVVGGNYRMVVLGRHQRPLDAAFNPVLPGWDISGGHIDETSVTEVIPQASLSWRQRWNGNWYSVEEKRKGDSRSVTVGDSDDSHHGHWRINITGSEAPDRWHTPDDCPGGACRVNPKILDETWAQEVRSTLGSSDAPIPLMLDETHAREISSETHATSVSNEQALNTMDSELRCGSMEDRKTCSSMLTSMEVGLMTDTTTCGLLTTLNITGLRSDVTIGSNRSANFGLVSDVLLGTRASLNLAATLDLSASLNFSVNIGAQLSQTHGLVLDASFPDGKELGTAVRTDNNLGSTCELALVHKTTGLRIEVG